MTTFQPEDVFLAAEVVSPESADRDRDTKPRKYAAAGIRHFWRVEKDADDGDRAVVHTFEPEPATGVYVPTGVFRDRLKVADPFPIDIDLTEIQPLGPPGTRRSNGSGDIHGVMGADRASTHSRRTVPPRAAFWLVAAAFAVTMAGTTLPTPLYAVYQRELGFSTLTVTFVFATYAAGVLAALLLAGHVSDQIGRRRTLLPGLVLAVLSSAVFLVAHQLVLLYLGRLLSGLSAGLFTGTATAALVDLAGEQHTARGSLVATVVQMGGLGSGPLLAGVLAEVAPAPLRVPYAVHLALLALVAVGVWCMPETVRGAGRRARLRLTRPTVPKEMRGVFTRAGIAGFAGFAVLGLFTAVSPAFLTRLLGLPGFAFAGAVIFGVFAASAVGQILLVPRFGDASLPLGCAGLVVGMGLLTAGFAALSFPLLLCGGLLAGLGQGMSLRSGLAAVNAAAPVERRADVASTFFVVLYVALSLPVIGVGVTAELAGLRTAGIAFSVVVALLAGGVLVTLRRAARRPSQPAS